MSRMETTSMFLPIYAVGNPNLTCIEVDDAEYSSDDFYWTMGIDSQMYFSEDCNYPELLPQP